MTQQGKHGSGDNGAARRLMTSVLGVVVGFLVVALLVFAGVKIFGDRGTTAASPASGSPSAAPAIPVPKVPADVLAKLPRATTEGKVANAPIDLRTASEGRTINIARDLPGFAKPGADPITVIPKSQFGSATWLPVINQRSGWVQVRLPARPNGATAWVPAAGLGMAQTSWSVKVALGAGTITVSKDGTEQGSWPIGQGMAATPTPVGQTFLLGSFVDPKQTFSPVIYALGTHSDTLDTYGGGPGTVAVHGWPTQEGRIGKVSHGCVRVPPAGLAIFAKLPTGTPIDITA
ncbi:L,D-transpeptidase [Flexivirga sp. ID2601S]|uniref:L,D-transpeptidase n=1 Tax=Flexivirga aerilata TaxID=1656889 RepID=A0A849AJM3_9MICO|nr:L,D-transpeptidase [Flexivirga aerilata]NNG38600.1 L,D-transpeptidase [Flexivirga aerilata]